MVLQEAGVTTAEDPNVARARTLVPLLDEAAPRIDAAGQLPKDVLDAMHAARLFHLLVPRSIGGVELAPSIYIQAVEQIARGDASAAWCMNQQGGCAMSAAYLSEDAAKEMFGGPRDALAWGQSPGARAIRTEGGWRLTCHGSFASGNRHCTWLGAHVPTFEADGTPRRNPDGKPADRTLLFPRAQAKITDTWQVVGLRGTGSDDYEVADLFVPDSHAIVRDHPASRREPGLTYRFSSLSIYASGFGAVALGIARTVLDAFIKLARAKTQALAQSPMRENAVIQSLVATADVRLRSARSWLIQTLRDAEAGVSARATLVSGTPTLGELTLDERVAIRQAATFAIAQARDVVNEVYHEAGSTAIFNRFTIERRFRDINTVSQQLQGRSAHFETVGQHMLGMEIFQRWL
jgi:alkylation response protein AidB-like acyl-CoA dehydrogenase